MQYEDTPERPQCGADTTAFLSDVYKKGTRAQKRLVDVPQSGRSMIEMLGVLAIVGVLSVGGITGYSKAMMKLKLNRWTSDIAHLITNIQLTYMTQGQYGKNSQSEEITSTLKSLDLIPDGMLDSSGNDIFGNKLFIENRYTSWHGNRLNIQFNTKGGKDSVEACKQYFTIAAQYSSSLWFAIISKSRTDHRFSYCGAKAAKSHSLYSSCQHFPLQMAKVSSACKQYCTDSCLLLLLLDNTVQ